MSELEYLKGLLIGGRIGRREFLGRTAALGVSAVAAASALGQAAQAATPKKGGVLKVGVDGAGAGDSLDPATYTAVHMQLIGLQLYSTLTELDLKAQVVPALAESWEAKPGAATWVLKLRKGVTFHNGKSLTPADVVHSINHHRGKDSKSGAKALVASIADIKGTGPDEVTVTLDSGNADLPYLLADYHLCIGPEGTDFKDGIGTGAFSLVSVEPGVRGVTKRFANFWRSDRGFVDQVETIAINDPTARVSALQSGSVDLINRADPKTAKLLEKVPSLTLYQASGAAHYCFPMRCDIAPFDNADLRLAMKYAIDREAIVKKILRGYGKVGNDVPVPAYDPFYAALPQRPYDPDKAKFHYKKSGYGGPIELSVSDGAFGGAVDTAQLFQGSAAKAGIKLDVKRVPADGYWDNVWLKAPFCASYWSGRPTPDLMFSIAYKSDAAWNETHWKRPDFDKLLIEARAELDNGKRKQMYFDLQKIVYDDCGEIIPMFNNFLEASSKKVHGYAAAPTFEVMGLRGPEFVWLG
ncbi:MAG: ABC transporter substrate-binding protein [Dongiaceae bacterium]